MAQTVLVTGGTGFIAGWVIRGLLEQGYSVRATVRSRAKEPALRAALGAVANGTFTTVEADLTEDAGWDAAVAGCDYVLHIASAIGASGAGLTPEGFIIAAREGTLRVLRAAVKAGVKRVVMTSAAAAARPPVNSKKIADETVWTDPKDKRFDPYRHSKILAEKAAWDFMGQQSATEFVTVLPGAVFGPVLSKDSLGTVRLIQGLMHGRPPGLPRLGFSVVDVRDLADLHIAAMAAPEAAGQRFLGTGEFMWFADIADALHKGLGEKAAKVPTRRLPDLVVLALAVVNPQMRMLLGDLGRRNLSSHQKATRMLGFSPRPGAVTVVDCAESLLRS